VRFRKGLAEKIGGWVKLQPQFLGICRKLRDWTSIDTTTWTALGTDVRLYLWQNGTLFNITPLRASGSLTNPFDTTISSSTVTVNHTAHGCSPGDYVFFSNADAVGGLTIDGEYQVQTAATNSFTIIDDETATSSVTGGGGTVNYEYELPVGNASSVVATGYGTGPYGREGYGNARTGSTLVVGIRTWSLDTWGEDLLACPRGGKIYWWDRSLGPTQRATALNEAPDFNNFMIVSTRDRHVISLGAYDYFNNDFDPMLIRWCSTEDLNDWIPTSTNTAGDLRLYNGSEIVGGVRSRLETVIFTDTAVYTLPFVGGFEVFGLNIVGENVTILGPNCAVPIDHRVLFMAESDFYMYDGVVRVVNCDVRNFVYDNLNVSQKAKIIGGLNREFNEVWWFYPSFDPDAWVQQTFELGLPTGYEISQPSVGGTAGYTYTFNSSGYTEVTATADNGYEHDYVLINDEPILDHDQVEFALELDVNPTIGAGTGLAGLCFLRGDIQGTIDTDADDVRQMMVELDYANNQIVVVKKDPLGVVGAPDNLGGNTANFTTVTGSPMATDTKYIITVQFSNPQITVWVDSNQAFQFDLSAAELLEFTDPALPSPDPRGSAGLHLRANAANDGQYRFYNFAIGPVGVLTNIGFGGVFDFDISPIEVNRYVAFNYEEGSWVTGKMARTAWADRSPLLEKAYAAGTDGYLYQHETGTDDDGQPMGAYIQSFDMEIPEAGEYLMHVDQIIPDFLTLEGTVDVTISGRKYPQDANRITKGPYTVQAGTRKISTRLRARQVAFRIESDQTGAKWRLGTMRARAGEHGKRG
jgi:hypothetical protein